MILRHSIPVFILSLVVLLCATGCTTPPSGSTATQTPRKPAAPAELPKARPHHYLFAHRALPQIFFGATDTFFLRLQSDPVGAVTRVWSQVGENLPAAERLPVEGLNAEFIRLEGGTRLVLVTCPVATTPPEAIYTALVIRGKELLYITYERTHLLFENQPPAILCGWNAGGSHLNYGAGGAIDRPAFDKILAAFLSKPAPEPAAITPPKAPPAAL